MDIRRLEGKLHVTMRHGEWDNPGLTVFVTVTLSFYVFHY